MSISDKGSIIYTVVARGDVVLAEYAYDTLIMSQFFSNFPTEVQLEIFLQLQLIF
jgi:hypothetical protein